MPSAVGRRAARPVPGPDVPLTYAEVGATRDRDLGGPLPAGYHHLRLRRTVGAGEAAFDHATETLMTWGMHRKVGMSVAASAPRAAEGVVFRGGIGVGPARVHFPCRVVYVVDTPHRKGFGYGTLPGHPECGEEAFVVALRDDGSVTATIVAFANPALWWARASGPLGRHAQRLTAGRYAAVLRQK